MSFRMDWLDLLAVQGTLKSLLQHHSSKASILWCSAFFMVQLSHPYVTIRKTIALTKQTFVGRVILGQPSPRLNNIPSFTWQNKQQWQETRAAVWSQIDDEISLRPGIINRNPQLQSLNSLPLSRQAPWDPFPIGTPDVLWHRTSQYWLNLDVGQNPIWWCILHSISLFF